MTLSLSDDYSDLISSKTPGVGNQITIQDIELFLRNYSQSLWPVAEGMDRVGFSYE